MFPMQTWNFKEQGSASMEQSVLEGTIFFFSIRSLTPCANLETIHVEAGKPPHSKGAYWQEHLHL